MNVLSWTNEDLEFEPSYNVSGKRLFPWADVESPNWEGAWVVLSPSQVSAPHRHAENEMFFFVEGTGTMRVDTETCPVRFGDTIYINNGCEHEVTNNGADRLVYVSIWWLPASDTADVTG